MADNKTVEASQQSKLSELASKIPVITQLRDLVETIQAWKFSIWAGQYNYSQWCYFIAGIIVMFNFFISTDPTFIVAGWVAFIGLVRELLHLFQHIWDNLIGKTIILILYASTANIAIAYAAMQINNITGIEPTPFVFTLGFTTLMLLPIWVTLSTIIVFSFFLIAVNLWLLIRLPLKMIGFSLQLHWEDKKNAVFTMLLRIFLIPFAVTSVLAFTHPYVADFVDEPLGIALQQSDVSEPSNQNENDKSTPQITSKVEQSSSNIDSPDIQFGIDIGNDGNATSVDGSAKRMPVKQLIAHFIWYLEAYPKSKCIKPEDARTVPIDEIAVLIISKDESADLNYTYEVTECKLRHKQS